MLSKLLKVIVKFALRRNRPSKDLLIKTPLHAKLSFLHMLFLECGRQGGLMVRKLESGASSPGLSPSRGHCVVFLGKTIFSHSASLHPGVKMGTGQLFNLGERGCQL